MGEFAFQDPPSLLVRPSVCVPVALVLYAERTGPQCGGCQGHARRHLRRTPTAHTAQRIGPAARLGSAPHGSARPGPAPPAAAAPRGAPRRHGALQAAAREGASCAFVTAPGHRAVTAPPHVDGKPAWPGVPRLLSPIGCPEPGGRVSHF